MFEQYLVTSRHILEHHRLCCNTECNIVICYPYHRFFMKSSAISLARHGTVNLFNIFVWKDLSSFILYLLQITILSQLEVDLKDQILSFRTLFYAKHILYLDPGFQTKVHCSYSTRKENHLDELHQHWKPPASSSFGNSWCH